MKWKFWIQERLYCTSQEVSAIVFLVAIVVVAHGIRIVRANISPFDDAYYAETDSLFQLLASQADSLETVDTLLIGTSYAQYLARSAGGDAEKRSPFDQLIDTLKYADLEMWIVKDTLEKPIVRFPLNINLATEKELQALPRIGPQMAKRIVEYRSAHPFNSTKDLLNVRGIGAKTLEKLAPLVTVSDSATLTSSRNGKKSFKPFPK